jgi:hypothetical protein
MGDQRKFSNEITDFRSLKVNVTCGKILNQGTSHEGSTADKNPEM